MTMIQAQTDFAKYLREKFPNDKIIGLSFPKGKALSIDGYPTTYLELYLQYGVGIVINETNKDTFLFYETERGIYSHSMFVFIFGMVGNIAFDKTWNSQDIIDAYEYRFEKCADIQKLY